MFLLKGLKKASMFVSCTAVIQSVITFVLQANMQVKRNIGKAILHKLSIYYEYMWLFWVSTLFGMTCFFFKCSESSTAFFHRFRSEQTTFHQCCKYATFLCVLTSRNARRYWRLLKSLIFTLWCLYVLKVFERVLEVNNQ